MRIFIATLIGTVILAITGITVALASSSARQGIGVQLMNTGSPGAPDYSRPDVYIGAQDDGLLPDPIRAGTSRTYTVKVVNTGNVPEQVKVFPAAASMTKSGYLASNNGVNKASSWTTATPGKVSLAASGTAYISVTVKVPAGTPSGTYYAVLWAAPVSPGGSGNLVVAILAGIREYITVG